MKRNGRKSLAGALARAKNESGFTLVELIVVIAILGILAGVGTVGYSGYIKKANMAADEILLDSLNTAFAAACVENGKDMNNLGFTPTATLTDGELTSISHYEEEFERYFNDGTFKFYSALMFKDGMFVGLADGVELDYNGHKIVVSQATIDALQSSTYGQKIGAEKLLGEIASLVDWVDGDEIDPNSLLTNMDYMYSLAYYLGVENAGTLDSTGLDEALMAKMEGLSDEEKGTLMINGLVYYAAENSTTMTTSDINELLNRDNIYSGLSGDMGTKLAQASMIYGMYTGYVNSDYYKGEATNVMTDPINVVKTVGGDTDFDTYVKSEQGQADLAAYLAAMGVINDSAGTTATKDVLVNGFDDENLVELMTQVLGK